MTSGSQPSSAGNLSVRPEQLRDVGLFSALSDSALDFLSQQLECKRYDHGETVFVEGEVSGALFIVLSGEMEVLKKSHSGLEARVAVLGPSDWFGEMSVVDVQPRSATVRTISPAMLIRCDASALDALYRHDLKSYSLVVLNIARGLSRRLRVADGLLADLVGKVLSRSAPPAG